MKFSTFVPLSLALAFAVALPASAAITYDADLASPGVYYGSGNPNGAFTVNTVDGVELGLRAHVYEEAPGTPAGNVYTFDLGDSISFDYSFNPGADGSPVSLRGLTSLLTITNVGTGATASFDPLNFPFNLDNATSTDAPGGQQNSQRLSFSFLNGGFLSVGDIGYDPNVDATYEISWDVSGKKIAAMNDTIYINQGAGATGAVPEPATWGMMILGFGLIGAAVRRRNVRTTVRFA